MNQRINKATFVHKQARFITYLYFAQKNITKLNQTDTERSRNTYNYNLT